MLNSVELTGICTKVPFLKKSTDGDYTEHWNVFPSGDWTADCRTGRWFARLALKYIRDQDRPTLMPRILEAVHRVNDKTGIEVGFLQELTESAVRGCRL